MKKKDEWKKACFIPNYTGGVPIYGLVEPMVPQAPATIIK